MIDFVYTALKKIFYLIKFYKHGKMSFSQSGEDLIINFIFNQIGVKNPTYLDIGANHPYYLNNTAFFYNNGSQGVNIEPDQNLFKNLINVRKRDINLNIGISDKQGFMDFYIMNIPTLNTLSKSEAEAYQSEGPYKIVKVEKIFVDKIEEIFKRYFTNGGPDLLNIDAEGIDESILLSIDFEINKPIVICIETISFSSKGKGKKNLSIIKFMESRGYILYADTNINTIFVLREKWER